MTVQKIRSRLLCTNFCIPISRYKFWRSSLFCQRNVYNLSSRCPSVTMNLTNFWDSTVSDDRPRPGSLAIPFCTWSNWQVQPSRRWRRRAVGGCSYRWMFQSARWHEVTREKSHTCTRRTKIASWCARDGGQWNTFTRRSLQRPCRTPSPTRGDNFEIRKRADALFSLYSCTDESDIFGEILNGTLFFSCRKFNRGNAVGGTTERPAGAEDTFLRTVRYSRRWTASLCKRQCNIWGFSLAVTSFWICTMTERNDQREIRRLRENWPIQEVNSGFHGKARRPRRRWCP